MADERETTDQEDPSSSEGRENGDDVPPSAKDVECRDSSELSAEDGSPHGARDSSDGVGDGGRKSPGIDESILAELVDEGATPEERDRTVAEIRSLTRRYHGPIPPAEEFAKYAEVFPDAPKNILDMAITSNQAAANRSNAKAELDRATAKAVEANAEVSLANAKLEEKVVPRGQYISGGLVLVLLLISAVAVVLDRAWYVALFGAGGLGLMFMNTLPSILNREPQSRQDSVNGETENGNTQIAMHAEGANSAE